MKMFRSLFAPLVLSILAAPHAALLAQVSTASINGIVRDSSGSVIPDAELTLTNAETNVERKSRSNSSGVYAFFNVNPGTYTMSAGKTGFTTSKIQPFNLAVNQTATFDLTLAVGAVTESVTIEAAGAEVQASTAEVGATVSRRQVVDLPLNGRNFTQLLSLTPGVAPISVSQNSGGFGATVLSGSQFTFPSINGQTNRSNFFLLDGVNNQGAFTSTYAVPPIVDTMEEFKVQSHNDQAEFGQALGGIINVVTKSGTNEIHGSAWEYVRNDAFDARGTYLPRVQVFRQNQFGAAGGGPVVLPKVYSGRNKTFFYLGYQGWRFRQPANAFRRVPTAANLTGDLSDEVRTIYNPFTGRPDPARPGSYLRDPFPGNRIPANLIDAGILAYAKAVLPQPNLAVGINGDRNYLEGTPFRQNQEEYSARVDHQISQKDFVWFRYSGLLLDQEGSGGLPIMKSIGENRAKNYAFSWNRTFSPTTVVQAQYGRVHVRGDSFNRLQTPANALGRATGFVDTFAGNFAAKDTYLVPSLSVDSFFGSGESNSLNPNFTNIHHYKANVSKIVGNHTLKWGGQLDSSNFEAFYNNASSTFQAFQTSNFTGNSGSQLASFLLNVPDSAGRRNVHETVRWGGVIGFYFQDQWKVTPKLTMNIGLRYDRTFIPPYGANGSEGENGGIDTGAYDLIRGVYILQHAIPFCKDRGRAPCVPGDRLPQYVEVSPTGKIYKDTTTNWGPRLGLAYRLTQKTAVRASFGIFYDNWAGVTQTAQNYEGGWPDVAQQLANNMNNPSTASAVPTHKGTNPFPEGLFPTPTPFNQVLWYMDPNHKNPYSMQWNFGVQHQIAQDTVVTMNYVGSGGRRLQLGGYYNTAVTPGPGDYRARTPFPYILPTFFDRSWGRSNYNSFQFLLDKKFRNGFAYMLNYTYAKAIDIGSSGWYGVEGHSVQDPYTFNRDRSVAAFDLTHVLSANAVYELPFGTGKALQTGSKAANYIIGGWQFNTIVLFRSGQPYTLTVNGDIANTGNASGYMRLNLVGDPKLNSPNRNEWFSRAAFASPAQYTFGNTGRNLLRSDGYMNWDFNIFRQFPFGAEGRRRAEFRAEAFNLFNQTVYGVPVANLSNSNFGRVTGVANRPRQLQLGLKLIF